MTETGTPSSTGVPALPFDTQRVCSSKIEKTFGDEDDPAVVDHVEVLAVGHPVGTFGPLSVDQTTWLSSTSPRPPGLSASSGRTRVGA